MKLMRYAAYEAEATEHDVTLKAQGAPEAADLNDCTLLTSLLNLYRCIPADDPDAAIDLMADWCASHAHPYADECFGAMQFMTDLKRMFDVAGEAICRHLLASGRQEQAKTLFHGCFEQQDAEQLQAWQASAPTELPTPPETIVAFAHATDGLRRILADEAELKLCGECGALYAGEACTHEMP